MNGARVWHATLSVIADYSPMTHWRMSNGAAFWWTLISRDQLLDDRFAEQPFCYAEIVSVCVFNEVRLGKEIVTCDWRGLRLRLLNIPGLRLEEMRDVTLAPASPPNEALFLTAPPSDL